MLILYAGIRLAGTLTLPADASLPPPTGASRPSGLPVAGDGRCPAALLINGSGPLDRDSAMPGMTLGLGPALAEALRANGIAVLRYDKRGVGESGGDYLRTGFHDERRDAQAALDALRAHPTIDPERVVVVGHSTGAVVAATLTGAAGHVLLAGSAQPGEQVMAWQSTRVAATLPRPLGALLIRRQARERERVCRSTLDPPPRMPRSRLTDRWLREYMAYDPAPALAAIDRPVLAITGGKDIQVDPADVARIGTLVTGPFTGEVPSDLTHLLRTDFGRPGLGRYRAQLARPVDAGLLHRVSAWIADVPGGRPAAA